MRETAAIYLGNREVTTNNLRQNISKLKKSLRISLTSSSTNVDSETRKGTTSSTRPKSLSEKWQSDLESHSLCPVCFVFSDVTLLCQIKILCYGWSASGLIPFLI